ncbi:MAG: cytochrome P450 [Rhizobiaceae bacterium]|nr:cytochrome P450 [Rhizobiaceae bacterium]
MTLLSWILGRVPGAPALVGRLLGDPMRYVSGKPLQRWLLLIDLPGRKLGLVNDPAVVETVMLDRSGQFPKAEVVHDLLVPLIRDGVFGQPGGQRVKETRRIFARSLAAIPDAFIAEATRRLTDETIERWLAAPPGRVAISEELSRLTVDVVSEVTLAGRFTEAESVRFARLFLEFNRRASPMILMLSRRDPGVRAKLVRDMGLAAIGTEMRDLMRRRFVTPWLAATSAEHLPPFLKSLAEAGRFDLARPDVETVLDEVAVMLLAGHETTASTLSWLAFELARRQDLQDGLSAVVARNLPDPALWNGARPDAAIDALGMEALRLYPPIGFFLRETTADASFRERDLPAGSFVVVAPWTLHRHRKFWTAPDDFDPGRWLGDAPPPPRTSYMPFGLGARSCPGSRFAAVEMHGILRGLLTRVRLTLEPGNRPKPLGNLTSRPHPEIMLGIAARRAGGGGKA